MLACIEGKIEYIDLKRIVLYTASWIGYEMMIHERVYQALYDKETAKLYVYEYYNERSKVFTLYGFLSWKDRCIFEEMLKVHGFWPKSGLLLLNMGTETLLNILFSEDEESLKKIRRIGIKLSKGMKEELAKKIQQVASIEFSERQWPQKQHLSQEMYEEALRVLISLGYEKNKVKNMLHTLDAEYNTLEKIISYIIKHYIF